MKNKHILFKLSFLFALLLYVVACNTDKLPEPGAGEECESIDATYDGEIKAIINSTCAIPQCHVTGGAGPGVFVDYAGLSNYTNDAPNGFRDRVVNLRNDPSIGMPPDNSNGPTDLTDEQLEVFKCWINADYPEN